jgi:hypothetical protein
MSNNPFSSFGRTVTPELFCGRSELLQSTAQRILMGASTSIVGERRIGKTSFLHYLKSPLAAERFEIDQERYVLVYLSLHAIRSPAPVEFWRQALQRMGEQALGRPWAKALQRTLQQLQALAAQADPFPVVKDLLSGMRDDDHRLVLLLDEFDEVARSPALDVSFFGQMRDLDQEELIIYVVASRDYLHKITYEGIAGSPFPNIFDHLVLRGFSPDELDDWLRRRLAGSGVIFTQEMRRLLLELGGYHPYFSEMAASRLFSLAQRDPILEGLLGDALAADVREDFRSRAKPQLDNYWERSSETEKVQLALLALRQGKARKPAIRKGYDPDLERLYQRGLLLRQSGDQYSLFSSAFVELILAEVYSQTAATPESFAEFVESYKSNQPLARVKRVGTSLAGFLTRVNPKYWGLFLKVILEGGSPDALLSAVELLGG